MKDRRSPPRTLRLRLHIDHQQRWGFWRTLNRRETVMLKDASSELITAADGPHAAANLTALIESTEDLIWSIDLNFGLLAFNSALQRHIETHWGTTAGVGKRPQDLLPADRAALWPPLFHKALSTGPFRTEIPFPNGRIVEMSFNPIVVGGKATGLSIFGRDVTERHRYEKELRETTEFLVEAQRIGELGPYVYDIRTGICTSSEVVNEILGLGKNADVAASWPSLIHPEDRLMVEQHFLTEVLGLGQPFNKECRIIRGSDKAERWLHGLGKVERDAAGAPLRMSGIIKDITERKRIELALAASEKLFRAVTDASPLAIHLSSGTDVWGDYMNPAFTRILGYKYGDIPSVTAWWSLAYPDEAYRRQVKQEWERRIEHSRNTHTPMEPLESVLVCKDGSKKTMSWGFVSVGERDFFYGHDLTEQKHAELQLRASQQRYRATFEQAAVGIAHIAFDGNFLQCNRRFADIIGYSPEEVLGLNAIKITDPAYLSQAMPVFEMCARGTAERGSFEKRYICKDGTLTWVKVSLSAQRDSHGLPVHVIAFVEDINLRKTAEERLAAAQDALRHSEERYRTAFQTTIDAININRVSDGIYIDVNEAFLEIIGFERDEVLGKSSLDLGIWADPQDRQTMVEAIRRNGTVRDIEAQFQKKNGVRFWGLMSASLIEIEDVPCVLTVTRDISHAKAAEQRLAEASEALRTSEERYRKVFETSLDPITINRIDNGQYIVVNQAFLNVMGFERDEVIGRRPTELGIWADPHDSENLLAILNQHGECRDLEIQFTRKNGETAWGLLSSSITEIDGVQCILTITRDISKAKAAEDEIRSLAFYDPLTGLPNRRLLLERLRVTLAAGTRAGRLRALLFVDLDNFKTLNDTLGHQTGDLLLQEAARRLTNCVRDADTVGRLGGDEFVLLLDELSEHPEDAAAQAKTVGEEILATISQPYLLDGRECRSSASIGIAVFGERRESSKEILQQADIAMYQAKAAGRNTMRFFAPGLQAAVNARAAMEEDLRQAIKAGQFELYYQPQIDRNRLTGAEALLRWNHPKGKILLPGEFIPLAEETGLILPLGQWVLEAACAQIAAWAGRKSTAKMAIAINISARQFRQPDFVHRVLAALDSSGANARNLRLELTESMLVENVQDVIDKMNELKSHGLRFSLDDFGTGYSSLAYLKKLPLDQLKIDRSFIRDILADESSAAIAQTIISLSRAMGLPVIAEGVETEQQCDFLTRIGCHAFQGYLFSRPLPLSDFQRQWLNSPETSATMAE
jgi:diguanylate cyclase (GGDEF)-like protein/PAS domain S-box-containing protein